MDNVEVCRICLDVGSLSSPLMALPCQCRGSMGLVHPACIAQWKTQFSNRQRCDVCGHVCVFTPCSSGLDFIRYTAAVLRLRGWRGSVQVARAVFQRIFRHMSWILHVCLIHLLLAIIKLATGFLTLIQMTIRILRHLVSHVFAIELAFLLLKLFKPYTRDTVNDYTAIFASWYHATFLLAVLLSTVVSTVLMPGDNQQILKRASGLAAGYARLFVFGRYFMQNAILPVWVYNLAVSTHAFLTGVWAVRVGNYIAQ